MSVTRSPAKIEASRRNGARSHGPVTADGKVRSSRNALQHGLCAMRHLVLEDEVPDDLEALIAHLTEETGATCEIEARLARRLAIAFWKGERAERIEVALFDAAPKIRPPTHGFQWEEADPLTTFDVRRFNAIRGQQAQIGREIKNCLAELRTLRKDAAARTDEPGEGAPEERNLTNDLCSGTDEPGEYPRNEPNDDVRNEPKELAAVNDDVAAPAGLSPRNEPGAASWPAAAPALDIWGHARPQPTGPAPRNEPDAPIPPHIAALRAAIAAERTARLADPQRDPAIMARLMRDLQAAWAELPDAAAG